jgi:hypothetical protein
MRLNSIWADSMAPIPVPKPPKKAYNPRRPAGTLLQSQLMHLEWAVRPAAQRTPAKFAKIKKAKSEAEAARRIEKLTRELKRQAESPRDTIPASAPAPKRRPRAKAKTASRSRRPAPRRKKAR